MNTTLIVIVAIGAIAYIIYKQCFKQPFTQKDILIPLGVALYLGYTYTNHASLFMDELVLGGAILGVGLGLLSGRFVRVWRDEQSGIIYQYGGWRYLLMLLVLIIVRLLLHVVLEASGLFPNSSIINDALLAMVVGNYLGRTINIGLRALSLNNLDYQIL